ncbi:MAG: hypothetical protein IJQ08_08645 [Synergistaceae bacterium]|nr:hypothetical protein [Synergistaceae bacterium]
MSYDATHIVRLKDIKTLGNKFNSIVNTNNAAAHNSIYRGKNLGTTITAAQSAAIRAGTFTDLYPGDYWQAQNPAFTWTDKDGVEHEYPANTGATTYYVAGCNCLKMIKKDNITPVIGNHVIVCMYAHRQERMNDTPSTEGGYANSEMATNTLLKYVALFKAIFGEEHIMKYGDWLCNSVTDGVESGYSWYENREADLLSEEMVFGRRIQNKANSFSGISQLPLFAFNYELLCIGGMHSWLRDAISSTNYACMKFNGGSTNLIANTTTYGVCNPFFLLN